MMLQNVISGPFMPDCTFPASHYRLKTTMSHKVKIRFMDQIVIGVSARCTVLPPKTLYFGQHKSKPKFDGWTKFGNRQYYL